MKQYFLTSTALENGNGLHNPEMTRVAYIQNLHRLNYLILCVVPDPHMVSITKVL